ncbi:glycosyltransferase family 4 protein [Patescibacteria group bacterium]|nr:glycosyltransferase family 4 protein [Patescibacteria group bacterium]MBU1472765.1 glycosyltransferase family 4 protein [Patescibacteria group bacterium]MBU2460031.1 glycosyltransferase family 4 protein [Patescibacteria group bacterium]MBU2544311.1 glycosyltransferase family 4 protein [Patescibacteria group bacterium]
MKIAIDISPLKSGHGQRGVGKYTKSLIEALEKYEKRNTYILFTRGQNIPKNADLVHYPYFDPFFLTLPFRKTKPTLVTVHDVIPLVFPDKFPAGLRGNLKWQAQKVSLKGAARIITDSNSSKRDIVRITGVNGKRIDVVYLAPPAAYKLIKDKIILRKVRRKYKIPESFIIYTGDVNWNKNISGLLHAFSRLSTFDFRISTNLVLVGSSFLNLSLAEAREINTLIDNLRLNNRIIRPGYVSEDDLVCLYSQALCLVQPSHYEGFGLPVLEAMACGCPSVVANNSSLSEIAGPSILVDANDVQSIAMGMEKVISMSDTERLNMVRLGIEWSSLFTWKKVAESTATSYESVLEQL